jgi:hypothetical protein
LTFGSQCDNALLVLTESQAMEKHTITLSSQLAYTPILLCTLSSVETNLQCVVDFENFNIVAPTQFARQCRAIRECNIQLSHILKIRAIKAYAILFFNIKP